MRDLFRNLDSCNTVCITVDSLGRHIKLYYQLNDNPVQKIWQQFYVPGTVYKTYPLTKLTLDQATDKLVDIARQLDLPIELPITQQQLNTLHNSFVEQQGNSQAWADLNTYIHIAETLLVDKFADYNSIIMFTHEQLPEYVPLEEKHKLWLTTEEHWGDLLLGYATIGKDWMDLAKNDDDLKDLNVQSTISPEARMFFHVEYPFVKHVEKDFSKWADTHNISLDNLNKLALGRYVLGHVIITDEFLKFNPNVSDWYVPNHKCKLEWNKQMIGADARVIDVEFFDSDMCFETLVKHGCLDDYA